MKKVLVFCVIILFSSTLAFAKDDCVHPKGRQPTKKKVASETKKEKTKKPDKKAPSDTSRAAHDKAKNVIDNMR